MASNRDTERDMRSHVPLFGAVQHDADGVIAAQRWAFAIVAAFVVVALVHAVW